MHVLSRVEPHASLAVALETTLLVHGVPRHAAPSLLADLDAIIRKERAHPALIGLVAGVPTVGMTKDELGSMLADRALPVPKAGPANLGPLIHAGANAATTVGATMEIAAAAGVRVFATGGLGGVHRTYARRLDISADLAALARYPVAVVSSGVKSLLDVESTREALETLGIPVIGFRTDRFPAFYLRESDADVDATFDDLETLARFITRELARAGRGIVVANPVDPDHAIDPALWRSWLDQAESIAGPSAIGRDATPRILDALHTVSGGRTLDTNLELVKSNARLAASLAWEMHRLEA